ncbi:MAG: hypothetical protein IKL76_00470 [Clostridia bacterium]|nr:hypothetical protein [Clostridia bacterium]
MNTILEHIQCMFMELYHLPKDEELENAESKAYDKLVATLTPEQDKLFNEFLDAHFSVVAHGEDETYKFGFSTGVRLVMETLNYPFQK